VLTDVEVLALALVEVEVALLTDVEVPILVAVEVVTDVVVLFAVDAEMDVDTEVVGGEVLVLVDVDVAVTGPTVPVKHPTVYGYSKVAS